MPVTARAPEPMPTLPADPLAPVSRNGASLGKANGGTLRSGVALPRVGPHHRVLAGRVRWATPELRDELLRAVKAVATAQPGATLVVGNASAQRGGRIRASVSHQSGRDIDLLFYALGARGGRPATPGRFHRYGPDGLSRSGRLRFDAARNWALVAELLSGDLAVQWIFVAAHLEEALLAQGRAAGAPAELLARAALVLHEPHGSTAHDDHFHLRVHCAPDDLLDGCEDYGPRRPWAPFPERRYQERVAALRGLLENARAPRRRRLAALRHLVGQGAWEAWPNFVALAAGDDEGLAMEGLRALRTLRVPEAATPLLERLRTEARPALRGAILDVLEAVEAPHVWPTLLALREDSRPIVGRATGSVGRRALEVLALQAPAEALPGVVAALPSARENAGRAALLAVAERIAGTDTPSSAPGEAPRAWAIWLATHGSEGQASWWEAGLTAAGHPLPGGPCGLRSVPALVDALDHDDHHIRHVALDLLHAITEMRPWRPGRTRLGQRFWRRWWEHTGEPTLAASPSEARGRREALPAVVPAPPTPARTPEREAASERAPIR